MFPIHNEEGSEVSRGDAGLENGGMCQEKEDSRIEKERLAWMVAN